MPSNESREILWVVGEGCQPKAGFLLKYGQKLSLGGNLGCWQSSGEEAVVAAENVEVGFSPSR